MTNHDDLIVDTTETTLYTELSAPADRVSLSIDPEDADKLSNTVTEAGRKAFLSSFFDALGVPDRDGWTAPDDFASKHPEIDDSETLQFRRRYEDAYHELATRGSEHVVAKFTQQNVSVEIRQAAPDDIHADERDDLTEWEQTALGQTFEWVDGVFTVESVETGVKPINGRKTSRRLFTLEYADGQTETMPVSIHKLHVDAGHITTT